MPQNTPVSEIAPKKIQRFSRLPVDREVAGLAQRVWKSPTFSAKDVNGTTQFIFSVPVQSQFRQKSPSVYRSLFEAKKTTWTSALENAYPETWIGRKRPKLLKDYINTLLYRLFYEGLLILNADTEGLTGDYAKFKSDFAVNFRAASPRTPGRPSRPDKDQTAIRLARRYAALLPQLKKLRNFVDRLKRNGVTENLLGVEVRKAFRDDWITFVTSGRVFEKLSGFSSRGGTEIAVTLGGKWAPWQATVGLIHCEEETCDTNDGLSVVTIYKQIMAGKKLIAKTADHQKE